MQSIEPQWKICQYSYSTIINHEILSREFLHLWDPLWIELKCSFRLFFNWNLSHMNFRLECFYEYFITKRTVIWKIKIITAATYGLKSGVEHEVMEIGEFRCGGVDSCHECKCWLVPRSDQLDHLTSPHREASGSDSGPGICLTWLWMW